MKTVVEYPRGRAFVLTISCLLLTTSTSDAKDFFLTIGGGPTPSQNQASLEKNVQFQQRLFRDVGIDRSINHIYFADGNSKGADLQVIDKSSLPKANRLMAEFFGSNRDLGLSYRDHEVANVRGASTPESIRNWFRDVGATMRNGDRLVLYVTAHGSASNDRSSPYNTTISLWNNQRLSVTELVTMLDRLPKDVRVALIMVQCHAGGFARFIYNEADSSKGLSTQERCGFFATLHDRQAAGCTPEVDEESYVEYSTYFWEALGGRSRTGQSIEPPDYDKDGKVSFDEAHAYTVLTADTIDLPIKTSGEFLGIESLFANDKHAELMPDDAPYDVVLQHATPSEVAILEGLSKQLKLSGNRRLEDARQQVERIRSQSRGRRGGRRSSDPAVQLRQRITVELKRRWPELANVLNPVSVELLTTRKAEFINAIESHREYKRYRELATAASDRPDSEKEKVKYERFVRTAENVILRENLRLLGDKERLAEYNAIVAAENGGLR